MTRATLFAGFFLLGCSADATRTSTDELSISDVTFSPGCGVKSDAPVDCTFGFVMTYVKDANVDTAVTVTHTTDNTNKTIEITVDAPSHTEIHTRTPEDASLGLLDAKAGQTYDVVVIDPSHAVLWSGQVTTLYHL